MPFHKGEKYQEKKEKDNYHGLERAYVSFQSLLSLSENADGLLLISLRKSETSKSTGRQMEYEYAL